MLVRAARNAVPVVIATLAVLTAAPAFAAEQTVIENPAVDAPGVCSESGVVGQTFTPSVGGELTQYGFSTAALDGAAGEAVSATVTISEWVDGDVLPIIEDEVELPAGAEQTLTMFAPSQPVLLAAGAGYAIEFDLDGFDTCPVAFGPGAPFAGGDLLLDGDPATGQDLAFRLVLGELGDPVNPNAPTIAGTPPSGSVGEVYSFQFTTTGMPAPTMNVLSGPLPPGIALSESGALSGTPTQAGVFPVMFNAENGEEPSAQLFHTFMIGAGLGAPDPTTAPPSAAPAPGVASPSPPARRTPKATLAESGVDVRPAVWLGGAALLGGLAVAIGAAVRRRSER